MASIFDNFFSEALTGDTIKDWDHASRLYVANKYNLAPKSSFLFHVFFEVNPRANTLNGMKDTNKQKELGMLVKQVSLPKFSADMAVLNAYNRPHVIQKKMHHSPVQITFHDDSANIVRNFWFDYYSYYYRNSDYGGNKDITTYNGVHKEIISDRKQKDWGYSIRGSTTGSNVIAPYLNSIRIFSLHNKQFSEYILVNPIIKEFGHGQHNSSAAADTMEHSMSVEYETVLYAYGKVSAANVDGFADLHYDKRPSPLSVAGGGGANGLLGPGGLVEAAGEISEDLESGNVVAALFKGARVTNGLKGANLGTMAAVAAGSLGKDILGTIGGTGTTNPFGSISVPGVGTLLSGLGGAASGISKINGLGSTVSSAVGIASAAASGGLTNIPSSIFNTAKGIGNSSSFKEAAAKIDGEVRALKVKAGFGEPTQGTTTSKGDLEA